MEDKWMKFTLGEHLKLNLTQENILHYRIVAFHITVGSTLALF